MKKLHGYPMAAALALGVAVMGACAEERDAGDELELPDMDRPATVDTEPMDRPADSESAILMTARFEPAEGAPSGRPITGSVNVIEATEAGGDYHLVVNIEGLSPGEHAWHIHSGPCGEKAPVVVPFTPTAEGPGLAQALTPGEGGVAEADVTVPRDRLSLEQLKSGDYSLHVHEKGGVDHGPTVACANL
jgi:Cu/Zn superoxide dismutase